MTLWCAMHLCLLPSGVSAAKSGLRLVPNAAVAPHCPRLLCATVCHEVSITSYLLLCLRLHIHPLTSYLACLLCRLPLPASRSCLPLMPPCRSAWQSSGAAAQRSAQQQHASWQTCAQPAAAAAVQTLQLLQGGLAAPVGVVRVVWQGRRGSAGCRSRASLMALGEVKWRLRELQVGCGIGAAADCACWRMTSHAGMAAADEAKWWRSMPGLSCSSVVCIITATEACYTPLVGC
jgi:hypothetical protein